MSIRYVWHSSFKTFIQKQKFSVLIQERQSPDCLCWMPPVAYKIDLHIIYIFIYLYTEKPIMIRDILLCIWEWELKTHIYIYIYLNICVRKQHTREKRQQHTAQVELDEKSQHTYYHILKSVHWIFTRVNTWTLFCTCCCLVVAGRRQTQLLPVHWMYSRYY